jgi:histidinol dehydrogenase
MEKRRIISGELTEELAAYVKAIIDEVKRNGDAALIKFTKEFDRVNLTAESFRVTKEEMNSAYNAVSEEQISALKFAKKNIEAFEKRLLKRIKILSKDYGLKVYSSPRPIQSVGCYIPGGEASYPSTLINTLTPAKVAGVPRIAVCSPPTSGGTINPLTLVAADICKIKEIYRLGGVQAIAALAYGTESIKPVKKILGPGNKYVIMAKFLVSRDVAIDLPAGPSEILVLADETAKPRIVALDMISQAEHSIDCVSGLVTTSKGLAEKVFEELTKITSRIPRRKVVIDALSTYGFIVLCKTMDEAIEFVNTFAPEHLEILTKEPTEIAKKITSAGLVLMGQYAPVSASDYCIGTCSVLPTSGYGHVFSGLSVLDFIRRINFIECSKEGLQKLRKNIKILAEAENLPNHFLAVEGRFKLEKRK